MEKDYGIFVMGALVIGAIWASRKGYIAWAKNKAKEEAAKVAEAVKEELDKLKEK